MNADLRGKKTFRMSEDRIYVVIWFVTIFRIYNTATERQQGLPKSLISNVDDFELFISKPVYYFICRFQLRTVTVSIFSQSQSSIILCSQSQWSMSLILTVINNTYFTRSYLLFCVQGHTTVHKPLTNVGRPRRYGTQALYCWRMYRTRPTRVYMRLWQPNSTFWHFFA